MTLFANPYTINAHGFYFETCEDYEQKVETCFDDNGIHVEEFEIKFIDGDDIDCELFNAWDVHQGNIGSFIEAVDTLNGHEKIALIALGECGYIIDESTHIDDIDIYYCENMQALVQQFIDDGLYGVIPESIMHYLDLGAMARDLSFEYTETKIGGQDIIYRCP